MTPAYAVRVRWERMATRSPVGMPAARISDATFAAASNSSA
jgi:hypothetical protein